jgi:hypothetical protein
MSLLLLECLMDFGREDVGARHQGRGGRVKNSLAALPTLREAVVE